MHLIKAFQGPQDLLLTYGSEHLNDVELLAALFGNKALHLEQAKLFLSQADFNLCQLSRQSLSMSLQIEGIPRNRALSLFAAWELGRRKQLAALPLRPKITCSKDVEKIMAPLLADLAHEEFWILLLNRANEVLQKIRISTGGLTGTVVDVKKIFRLALGQERTAAIIACHNHPSGNPKPSDADIRITQKLREAATLLDLKLFDHLIIVANAWYSFADEGQL